MYRGPVEVELEEEAEVGVGVGEGETETNRRISSSRSSEKTLSTRPSEASKTAIRTREECKRLLLEI